MDATNNILIRTISEAETETEAEAVVVSTFAAPFAARVAAIS